MLKPFIGIIFSALLFSIWVLLLVNNRQIIWKKNLERARRYSMFVTWPRLMNSKVFYVLINSNFIKYIISIFSFFKKEIILYIYFKFFIFEVNKKVYMQKYALKFVLLSNYKRFNFAMKMKVIKWNSFNRSNI